MTEVSGSNALSSESAGISSSGIFNTGIFSPEQRPAGAFTVCEPADLLRQLVLLAKTHGLQAAADFNDGKSRQPQLPRVVIDGPSGSGKSTLGKFLARELNAQLVQLDHVYASWNGLAEAGQRVATDLLMPLAAGQDGKIRHWDWHNDCAGKWQEISSTAALVVEGSAALNQASAKFATLKIWVEVKDESARRVRALEQRPGGDIYAPYWEHWAAQERAHIELEKPRELADIWLEPGVAPGDTLYRLVSGALPG